jgi:hypothetical protein
MAYRVRLKKKWVNMFGRSYPVGTVLQTDAYLGSELIRLKYGDKYDGDYPPSEKKKINLEQLNNNENGST